MSKRKSNQVSINQTKTPSSQHEESTESEISTDHPPRKRSKDNHKIKQTIRKLVWETYVGYNKDKKYCWCCNVEPITAFDFECGHIQARSRGGLDSLENLRPICRTCNGSMGAQNLLEFQKLHGLPIKISWWERLFGRR